MKILTLLLLALAISSVSQQTQASMISYKFSQDGFEGGGSVSGFFRGTDLNNDGRIYAASATINSALGLPFGNELDYAEVTFSGFGATPGPSTIIYDKSVADMNAFQSTFWAFAYNLDGGELGDEENEGLSFSTFSPSTNLYLGSAFLPVFQNEASREVGVCDGVMLCSAILGYEPDADSPIGAVVTYENYTSEKLRLSQVPVPATFSLFMCAAIILMCRKQMQKK